MTITYQRTLAGIDWSALSAIIRDAGLGEAAPEDLERAYTQSTLFVFAFVDDTLVGAARALSDTVWHAQICDMVVTPVFQGRGIGRRMAEELLYDLRGIKVLLTASFGKEGFYRKLGFRRHKTALAYNYGAWWYEAEALDDAHERAQAD
jgi:GNAT superfamily N-acetyltransferase